MSSVKNSWTENQNQPKGNAMASKIGNRRLLLIILVIVAGLMFGWFTTAEHIRARGLPYFQDGNQVQRHQAVLDGNAGNPWQYRVLSVYVVEGLIHSFEEYGAPYHTAISFILFRAFVDIAIFLVSFLYFRKLGLSTIHALIGMSLLAWGMSYAHYDSDLQLSTYLDVLFYLLAGVCILYRRPIWIIPITFFAALNRETSGLIPLLFLFSFVNKETISNGFKNHRRDIAIFGAAFTLYVSIFFLLRNHYGPQTLFIPYEHHPGFDLLRFNLTRYVTWDRLFATLGIIPLLAVLGYQKWTEKLKITFWVIVPIWFLIHLFGSVIAEARLLLVPYAMVFIPGALLFAQQSAAPDSNSANAS